MAVVIRRLFGTFSVLLLTLLFVAGTARTADAADGFKYWNYFHVTNGKYVFAQTGPDGFTPKDGTVEAYRYGLSSTAAGITPRTAATTYTAAAICKGTTAKAGQKQVGVLIDYGIPADAGSGETPPKPRAGCAVVPTDANGLQVLDAVADVRLEKQLVCGIDGYPIKGCSVTVKNPPAAATASDVTFSLPHEAVDTAAASSETSDSNDGGFPWPLVGVVAVVVVLGGGALALSRRNKSA